MTEDRVFSAILGFNAVQPSYLRPTSVLPGRTAQVVAAIAFFGIRPTVLPKSPRAGARARTRTHTRARNWVGRVGRLDGFMGPR